ncbi:T9SS type A sorting domain-containing protein [Rufibacter latericius]|uniref:T9SS C-terminal target domain-containing protein n=1 Tax=Rufibacter latericius TaxID=2487040 RepID=A0A3M9N114_9BACT|nr:Ig-like domain-containing protein [Rufibacter latericius]RNI31416.1 T9SS C-terminal target domain-containing protein [Rufibacter latericius]
MQHLSLLKECKRSLYLSNIAIFILFCSLLPLSVFARVAPAAEAQPIHSNESFMPQRARLSSGLTTQAPFLGTTIYITSSKRWSDITTGTALGGEPSLNDVIVVSNGATLTVNNTRAKCASISIGAGGSSSTGNGTLILNPNTMLVCAGNIIVGGTSSYGTINVGSESFLKVGGAFTKIGANSTVTTGTGSLIEYNGSAPQVILETIPYHHLTLSGSGEKTLVNSTLSKALTVNGNFTMNLNAGVAFGFVDGAGSGTLKVKGDFNLNGGSFLMKRNAGSALVEVTGNFNKTSGALNQRGNGVGSSIITVGGNFSHTGGTYNMSNAAAPGVLNVAGNFTQAASNLTESGIGGGQIFFNGKTEQSFNRTTDIDNNIDFTVRTGAIVNFGTATLTNTSTDAGPDGPGFTLESGGTIITAHNLGLAGSIQVSGPKSFSSSANYEFRGSNTGTFATTPAANTVNNLVVNRSSGLTLDQSFTVNGNLDFKSGSVTLANPKLQVTIGAGGNIINEGPTKYLSGKLARSFSGTGSIEFPVGENEHYRTLSLNYANVSGTSTVIAEQFETGFGGTFPSGVSALGSRFWRLTQIGGSSLTYSITLDGTGTNPDGEVKILKYNAGNSTPISLHATTGAGSKYTASGLDSFGDFVLVQVTNQAPRISEVSKSGEEDNAVMFAASDFTGSFSDSEEDNLQKVRIASLPLSSAGILNLGTIPVTVGQEIATADVSKLSFIPAKNFNGTASFTWNGFDGVTYASGAEKVILTIDAVNDAPSFTIANPAETKEDAGPQALPGFATAINDGDGGERVQNLIFTIIGNSNPGLFSVAPAIDETGKLTFTSADNGSGEATITIKLEDNGGTANGGVDVSAQQEFVITVTPVNDQPTLGAIANPSAIEEDADEQTIDLSGIGAGAPNENQALAVTATSNNTLLIAHPTVEYTSAAETGSLKYTPVANAYGTALITVRVSDGSAENGFVEKSFTVTINAVNDAPSFTKGADQEVNEDAGVRTINAWATALSAGQSNESAQKLDFIVTNDNNELFSTQPAVSANGTLSYTLASNAHGTASVSVKIKDDGGTANGGKDESALQSFTITVNPVNDAPVVANNRLTQSSQYSNLIAPVTITATDVDNAFDELSATASWKLKNAAAFSPGLGNTGLSLTNETGSWSLAGKALLAPGTYTIRVAITDGTVSSANNSGYTDFDIVVTPETSIVTYSGLSYFSTANASSNSAIITLSATVTDVADAHRGDIRNARVTFRSGSITGPVLGASKIQPVLINGADATVGTVSTTFTYALSNTDFANKGTTLLVYAVVEDFYTGNNCTDPGSVTVSVPGSDAVTGGGFLSLTNSIGAYAGTNGTKTNFGFSMKFNKNGGSAKGQCNIIIRSNNKVYQIKSNAINSLSTSGKFGNFSTKATLTDITNPSNPVSLGGNLDLLVDMYDVSNGGQNDELSISLKNGSTILFSSNWTGATTARKVLGGGNVQVQNGITTSITTQQVAATIAEPIAGIQEATLAAYPNPFQDQATIQFAFDTDEEYTLTVYSANGALVKSLKPGKAQAKKLVQVQWGEANTPAGVYIVRLASAAGAKTIRIVRQ